VRRVGPVLNPPVIGSSALGALKAPCNRFDEVADIINGLVKINHNYERDHRLNIWFVVTASTPEERSEVFERIAEKTGCEPLRLPMETEYYVDLAFPVVNDDRWAREKTREKADTEPKPVEDEPEDLSELEATVVLAIQDGLPVSNTPYADLASSVDASREDVIRTLRSLSEKNCIKRTGLVVNHHAVGFDSNCMVVWRVPRMEVDTYGRIAGSKPYVTYCCHRAPRSGRGWDYTMFTMIHGRDPDAVDRRIDELAEDVPFKHERLETVSMLKQTGVRYSDLVGADDS
jgi:DNA-binding Lrp family transcriptional regulator